MRARLDTRELGLALSACATFSALVLFAGFAAPRAAGVGGSGLGVEATFVAWLGLTLAGWGAFSFARLLGLASVGASLTAVGYAGSGFGLSRLTDGAPLVSAALPWLLLAIEGVHRTSGRARACAAVGTALLSATNLLAGDPHASSCNALCAAAWSLALWVRDRRAALWSAGGLLLGVVCTAVPLDEFVASLRRPIESLSHARAAAHLDYLALACFVFLVMTISWWRASRSEAETQRMQGGRARVAGQAATVVLGVLACAYFLSRRGESPAGALALCPDLLGAPERAGVQASTVRLESLRAWMPLAVLTGAVVSLLSRRGLLTRRAPIQVLACAFMLVAVHAPGVVDVWRELPVVGLIAPARAAGAGALMLGLLAGEVFELRDRATRSVSAVLCTGLAAMCVLEPAQRADGAVNARLFGAPDPDDELVGWIERPSPSSVHGQARAAGWVHPELRVDRVIVRLERLDERGARIFDSVREVAATWEERAPPPESAPPPGARVFRASGLDVAAMPEGVWRIRADFYRDAVSPTAELIGSRIVALSRVVHEPHLSISTACMLLAMSILLCLPSWSGPTAWGVVLFAALQALHFVRAFGPRA